VIATISTPQPSENQEVFEIVALANKLHPAERAKFIRAITDTLHPALQPNMFGSKAEWVEYLMAQPDAVVEYR